MKVSQIGTQKFGNSSKIGQHVKNAGDKFVNGCVDFAISSQDKMGNLFYTDETSVGKLAKKVTKSSFAQEFVNGFINTYKTLGNAIVETAKNIVTK